MRFLGVDYGTTRIGLAVSDETGWIATPLAVIERTPRGTGLDEIAAAVKQHQAGRVVVGLPVRLDGTDGPAAKDVRRFAEDLSKRVDVPVDLWDERLTSAQAQRALIEGDVSRRRRKERVDAVAAQIMLQSYLDAQRARGDA